MPTKQQRYLAFTVPSIWIGIMCLVHFFKVWSGYSFHELGIYPRFLSGTTGILFAPFIHGDWAHLFHNIMPFYALGLIMYFFYPRVASKSLWMIYFMTGISVWAFADYNYHIGASGVVYGMVSFVFWSGVFRRNLKSIVLALIILFFYQGFFAGLIPKEGVSWESHLYGALAGIFSAFFYKDHIEQDEEKKKPSWELEQSPNATHFLPRDIFDKTRAERIAEQQPPDSDPWTHSST